MVDNYSRFSNDTGNESYFPDRENPATIQVASFHLPTEDIESRGNKMTDSSQKIDHVADHNMMIWSLKCQLIFYSIVFVIGIIVLPFAIINFNSIMAYQQNINEEINFRLPETDCYQMTYPEFSTSIVGIVTSSVAMNNLNCNLTEFFYVSVDKFPAKWNPNGVNLCLWNLCKNPCITQIPTWTENLIPCYDPLLVINNSSILSELNDVYFDEHKPVYTISNISWVLALCFSVAAIFTTFFAIIYFTVKLVRALKNCI